MANVSPYLVAKVEARNFAADAHETFERYVKEYADTHTVESLRTAQHNWSQYLFWTEAAKVLSGLAFDEVAGHKYG